MSDRPDSTFTGSVGNEDQDPGAGPGIPDFLPQRVAEAVEAWNDSPPQEDTKSVFFGPPSDADLAARRATEDAAYRTHVVASGITANDPTRPVAISSEVVEAIHGVEEVIRRRETSLGNADYDVADLSGEDRRLLGLYAKPEDQVVEIPPEDLTGGPAVGEPSEPTPTEPTPADQPAAAEEPAAPAATQPAGGQA